MTGFGIMLALIGTFAYFVPQIRRRSGNPAPVAGWEEPLQRASIGVGAAGGLVALTGTILAF